MAYILGFIAADGSVYTRKDRKDSYILNITNKEKGHLKQIKDILSLRQKVGSKRSGYTGKKNNYYLQTNNKGICKDLISLGITPQKTYSFELPKIHKNYFSDFVRGFFDGDGTVYIYQVNGTSQIKAGFVSSSLSFITNFNQRLCKNLNIPPKSVHSRTPKRVGRKMIQHDICFYVDDCEKLADFMYKDKTSLCLSRKYKIFQRWKSIQRRHYTKHNYPSKIGW